jgi:hypothetical protein
MGEHTRKGGSPHQGRPGTLGELIHEAVRRTIELAVEEELTAALGAACYARDIGRGGYRNGSRGRILTGPTGPLALTLPRATLFTASGTREWTSTVVPPLPAPAARGQRSRNGDLPAERRRGAGREVFHRPAHRAQPAYRAAAVPLPLHRGHYKFTNLVFRQNRIRLGL